MQTLANIIQVILTFSEICFLNGFKTQAGVAFICLDTGYYYFCKHDLAFGQTKYIE